MNNLLYKLQLCGYRNRAYLRIARTRTSGAAVNTPRLRRLRSVSVVLIIIGLGLPLLFLPHTIALTNLLMTPIENAIKNRFLKRAKQKLTRMPNLIKIGITGSYGKTTVKTILTAMLSAKYKVCVSPDSFNTPMGFARTVNEHLTPADQILIMEMGARHRGDIAEMCALLHPDHGIITGVGPCHLETFGSIAAVANTKAELFAALPFDACAVTDGDDPLCSELWHPNKTAVTFAAAPEIPPNALLGKHNKKNILLARAMAHALGVPDKGIQTAISTLKPVPHRLELITAHNGLKIIDDGYNSNPTSAKCALDVMSEFTGYKVVQTPGFVEQGQSTRESNFNFGAAIAAAADAVIVVGGLNSDALYDGLLSANFPAGNIHFAPTRDEAKNLYAHVLKSGAVLLIENDIPEQYTENV